MNDKRWCVKSPHMHYGVILAERLEIVMFSPLSKAIASGLSAAC